MDKKTIQEAFSFDKALGERLAARLSLLGKGKPLTPETLLKVAAPMIERAKANLQAAQQERAAGLRFAEQKVARRQAELARLEEMFAAGRKGAPRASKSAPAGEEQPKAKVARKKR